jgi:hypothetical protein
MPPVIYDRSESGIKLDLPGTYKWGHQPEDPWAVTFHHSAGPRAKTYAQACALHRSYQLSHIARNFGDIGYHASMDDLGRFYLLRPLDAVGAHVGGHNTGNLGIMLHGNYMHDKLNRAQKDSLKWLFRGGFAQLLKVTEADIQIVRGHQEWSGHNTNECPGVNLMRHVRYLRNTETW